jgi:hypothetical protein
MPSTSPKQARTMAAAAHNPAFAKKVGIPQGVAKDFNSADTGGSMLSEGSKGRGPSVASYAAGGPVLGRTRDFLKEQVEFRDGDEGKGGRLGQGGPAPADKDQKYAKSGEGSGKGIVAPPEARGKQLSPVKPRK